MGVDHRYLGKDMGGRGSKVLKNYDEKDEDQSECLRNVSPYISMLFTLHGYKKLRRKRRV